MTTPTAATPPNHPSPSPAGGWPLPLLVLVLAVWLASVGNIPLWRQLMALPEIAGARGLLFGLGLGVWLAAVLVLLLSPLAWPRVFKPVAVALLLTAAACTHFMLAFSVVIDPSMLLNVLNTDAREVADLLSLNLLLTLLGVGVLPAWWLWRQPVRPAKWQRRLGGQAVWMLGSLALAGLVLVLMFQDFASLMRNHKQVRYLINPLNSVYALGRVTADTVPRSQRPLLPVGTDAQLGKSYTGQKQAPWLVLVVGETARAANFGLGGYARDTTPRLRALQAQGELSYFANVRSCGTNTQASVPCMFSHLGKTAYEASDDRHENLLDVLHRAGLGVAWIDNQSGCKGVCDRVPTAATRDLKDPAWCAQGECFDEVMLVELQRQLTAMPSERKARGVVVVLHQMGSHGPAYHRRAPESIKTFAPECTSNALQECTREALVNTYDNSIRYTDHLLAQTVAWLKQQAASTALLYVSDHGESLGENNLYLHGLPYALAPVEQKHVPMLTWLSPAMQQRSGVQTACLNTHTQRPLTHDNLFHSVLGLMDVQTSAYQPELDVFRVCAR
jgi:lipid A ethanolaminephosphotransferase